MSETAGTTTYGPIDVTYYGKDHAIVSHTVRNGDKLVPETVCTLRYNDRRTHAEVLSLAGVELGHIRKSKDCGITCWDASRWDADGDYYLMVGCAWPTQEQAVLAVLRGK